MSRSGYSEDLDEWSMIRWRGAVKSAISRSIFYTMNNILSDTGEAMDDSLKPITTIEKPRIWVGYSNCNDYKQEICIPCTKVLHDPPIIGQDHHRWVQSTVVKYGCMICGKTLTDSRFPAK